MSFLPDCPRLRQGASLRCSPGSNSRAGRSALTERAAVRPLAFGIEWVSQPLRCCSAYHFGRGISGGASQQKYRNFSSTTVFGRPGQPAELASIYVQLAAADASFATGTSTAPVGDRASPRRARTLGPCMTNRCALPATVVRQTVLRKSASAYRPPQIATKS